MSFNPSSLGSFMLILTAWGGAFLAALWLSLVIWSYRDIRSRARDPLARILAVLVVAVLFLPGILIYLILRPQRPIAIDRRYALVPGLWAAREGQLAGMPQLPHAFEEKLPPVRQVDGTALESVSILRYACARHAARKLDFERGAAPDRGG